MYKTVYWFSNLFKCQKGIDSYFVRHAYLLLICHTVLYAIYDLCQHSHVDTILG